MLIRWITISIWIMADPGGGDHCPTSETPVKWRFVDPTGNSGSVAL